uniref:Uncharacterized protein n=1 Tax=Chromera velia CCMP2878 TaxID=1169474 RepID=A0A0G4I037_9ALVE|eukprot:Cvel_9839.t1-p1 / transcript=Cvel_9839.t1 / gene=Cvel_9839 / organism=Chromera_velia_CCMP2878 / gene_product=hypothetical protein / transcript_product=hypothetical protein / location=Cvel_scaffold579:53321-57911(-) / protein_length=427 / sequence_SO=supercontig / SO=protein_coding / is_pseudo=false
MIKSASYQSLFKKKGQSTMSVESPSANGRQETKGSRLEPGLPANTSSISLGGLSAPSREPSPAVSPETPTASATTQAAQSSPSAFTTGKLKNLDGKGFVKKKGQRQRDPFTEYKGPKREPPFPRPQAADLKGVLKKRKGGRLSGLASMYSAAQQQLISSAHSRSNLHSGRASLPAYITLQHSSFEMNASTRQSQPSGPKKSVTWKEKEMVLALYYKLEKGAFLRGSQRGSQEKISEVDSDPPSETQSSDSVEVEVSQEEQGECQDGGEGSKEMPEVPGPHPPQKCESGASTGSEFVYREKKTGVQQNSKLAQANIERRGSFQDETEEMKKESDARTETLLTLERQRSGVRLASAEPVSPEQVGPILLKAAVAGQKSGGSAAAPMPGASGEEPAPTASGGGLFRTIPSNVSQLSAPGSPSRSNHRTSV